jgi:general secretion pathway protein F
MADRSLTLAEFIAFNDQLAAFARLGVPLQEGLRELATDGSNPLRKFCLDVGGRIERGQTLAEALGEVGRDFPPTYRLLVEAGSRTGQLPDALAATSRTARRMEQLRRLMATASIYPLILCLLAWGLTFAFVLPMLGRFEIMYRDFRTVPQGWEAWLFEIARAVQPWWWTFPVLFLAVVARLCFIGGGGLTGGGASVRGGWARLVPGLGFVVRNCEMAASCELLAAGVEHSLPLKESLPLVAATVTDDGLKREFEQFASGIGRVDQVVDAAGAKSTRMLGWLLSRQGDGATLALGLRQLAALSHERAHARVRWLALHVPMIFAVATGSVVVAAYALLVFGPLIQFWKDLVV